MIWFVFLKDQYGCHKNNLAVQLKGDDQALHAFIVCVQTFLFLYTDFFIWLNLEESSKAYLGNMSLGRFMRLKSSFLA